MRRHPSREPPLHADPTRRTIVLGPKAHELRAYVGSTAWAVLEEMMQRSTGDGEHVVAQASIRSLASSLGLAKDTVARSESGVFEAGSYRLAVPVACISVVCPSQLSVASSAPRPSSARRSSGQLSLLSEV